MGVCVQRVDCGNHLCLPVNELGSGNFLYSATGLQDAAEMRSCVADRRFTQKKEKGMKRDLIFIKWQKSVEGQQRIFLDQPA